MGRNFKPPSKRAAPPGIAKAKKPDTSGQAESLPAPGSDTVHPAAGDGTGMARPGLSAQQLLAQSGLPSFSESGFASVEEFNAIFSNLAVKAFGFDAAAIAGQTAYTDVLFKAEQATTAGTGGQSVLAASFKPTQSGYLESTAIAAQLDARLAVTTNDPAAIATHPDMSCMVQETPGRILQYDRSSRLSPYFGMYPSATFEKPCLLVIDYDRSRLTGLAKSTIAENVPNGLSTEKCFEIKEIAGKGRCMVATRTIQAGELIIKERPFYVYVNSRTRPISGSAHRDAASRLCEASRSAFLNLQNCYPADECDRISGIISTNAYPIAMKCYADNSHLALFPNLPMANHSCAPNAFYVSHFLNGPFNDDSRFDKVDCTGRFYAMRDIQEGEEITTSYIDADPSRDVRRKLLYASWRFECGCTACSLSEAGIKTSDRNRALVAKAMQHVRTRQKVPMEASLFSKAVAAAEVEGLLGRKADLLMHAGQARMFSATSLSDLKQALKYTQAAHELSKRLGGADWVQAKVQSDQAVMLSQVVQSPNWRQALEMLQASVTRSR